MAVTSIIPAIHKISGIFDFIIQIVVPGYQSVYVLLSNYPERLNQTELVRNIVKKEFHG